VHQGESEPIEPFVKSIQVPASIRKDDDDVFDPNATDSLAVETGLDCYDISGKQLWPANRE